ncbi:hypothetical protein PCH_Pc20g10200 [Penicillium rubens Wisconsin 54-1255]|uniref:Uncharacterized protein n=1 Tax=Penicillium rubens (strain ATCC 28089 / DSM 1075 / NRRL 1951 / Wisconsin 54-1255) TaxID=500485 RepID=B6HFM0_PENRW|nr:hypothetical protein PCH_Pc20g10200 [Penicillium rubens Wisconsin 54-1255]
MARTLGKDQPGDGRNFRTYTIRAGMQLQRPSGILCTCASALDMSGSSRYGLEPLIGSFKENNLSRSVTEDCKLGQHKSRLGTDVRRDWNVEHDHRQVRMETSGTCADGHVKTEDERGRLNHRIKGLSKRQSCRV